MPWLSFTMTSCMILLAIRGLISTAVTSLLPEASARETSYPPPGPIIRALAAQRVGESGTLAQETGPLLFGKAALPIESGGDPRGGIGIDADQPVATLAVSVLDELDTHARKAIPGRETLLRDGQAFGPMDIEPMSFAVHHHQKHHQQRDQNGADTQTVLPGLVIPERRSDRIYGCRGDH